MRDGVRLGIDYGSASAAAVVSLPHTAAIPIPVEPAGVFVEPTTGALITGQAGAAAAVERPDCYVTPVHHLAEEAVTVANQQIPVVDLLAAALASLATTAAATAGASITSIGIAIPAGWGPTRRALIQQGADRAGLPVPELVAAPAAVASHLATVTGAPPPEGACVLVCDAGASGLHLTALEQQGGGHLGVLATASIADVGGDAIDAALTGHATTASATGTTTAPQPSSDVHINNARERYALLAAARHAKHQLASTWRAAIPLPDGGVGVIDRDQLATLTKPALDHLGRHIDDVLAAADIDRTHLAAVILTGSASALPGLAASIGDATGRPPITPPRPELAAAYGAAHAASPPTLPSAAPPNLRQRWGVRQAARVVAMPLLIWAASAALLVTAVTTTWTSTVGSRVLYASTNMAQIGAAGAVAMLAAFAAAHLAVTAWIAGSNDPHDAAATGALIRRAYPGTTTIGLIIAAIYGLSAGLYIGVPVTPHIRWTILAALPIATAAAIITTLGGRIPTTTLAEWVHATRAPLIPALLAAAGSVLTQTAISATSPSDLLGIGVTGRIGAVLLATGIAGTITRQPLLRIAAGTVLAAAGLIAFTVTTVNVTGIAYLCALAWWATTAMGQTLRHGFPGIAAILRRWVEPPK